MAKVKIKLLEVVKKPKNVQHQICEAENSVFLDGRMISAAQEREPALRFLIHFFLLERSRGGGKECFLFAAPWPHAAATS